MALSNELISQFAKVMAGDKKKSSETTVYGTVVTDGNGNKYVKLDGSDQLTPLTDNERPSADLTLATANDGERVSVLIKDHSATITGNLSSPAVRTGDFKDLDDKVTEIKQFDIVIAEQVQANYGYIKKLEADKASIGELEAAKAEIGELIADKASIGELNAVKASVEDLEAKKLNADVAEITYATIESLNATNAKIDNLDAEFVSTEELKAVKASIDDLDVKKLDVEQAKLKYANIDFANITKAAIENFYAKSGIIKDLVVGDTTVTGKLVGITIVGDLIEGGTIKADKLVVLGSDGLYYKLNTDGVSVSAEQTEYNSLNGSIITAHTITAEKVNVHDLVAFDATIGGFHISDHAVYSGVKSSVDNTTRGIYLGDAGELNVGDETNYLKYYRENVDAAIYQVTKKTLTFKGEWDSATNYTIDDVVTFDGSYYIATGDATGMIPDTDPGWEPLSSGPYDGDVYTKTSTVISEEPTGGVALGVSTTTGEEVYSYIDGGATKYYCKSGTVTYKLAISADSMIFSATGKTVDDTIGDVQTSFSKQTADVISACNDAISEALEGYVENGDYTKFRETVNAQLAILSDRITMNFNTTVEEIDSFTGDVENRFTTLSKYINFSQDGIKIGSGESTLKLTIDNDRICFEQDGKVKGWWDGSDFHTGNIMIEVSERAQFGNFAFIPRSDGSLMFLKVNNSTD